MQMEKIILPQASGAAFESLQLHTVFYKLQTRDD
jgi:hypothetical protein